jgi:CheY-like chemotaxis protein
MQAVVVGSGREALTAFNVADAGGKPFDVLLVDASMPELDGLALVELLPSGLSRKSVVLMLTTSQQAAGAAWCREHGTGYLIKPLLPAPLQAAIAGALGGSPRPARETAVVSGATGTMERARPRPLDILVAEDNAVNQQVIRHLLEKQGHCVTMAANGLEAIAAWERHAFDLVLMDIQMPAMAGPEATALIRDAEKRTGQHVPIIALTAHAMKGDRERCLEAGMDGYLAKPIAPNELFEVLDGIGNRSRA